MRGYSIEISKKRIKEEKRKLEGGGGLCCHAGETLRVHRYDSFSVDWFGHKKITDLC